MCGKVTIQMRITDSGSLRVANRPAYSPET